MDLTLPSCLWSHKDIPISPRFTISRLTRDGTTEPVSRDQILRPEREQGNINFPCSADLEQDWQPYQVDPYSATCDDHACTSKMCYSYDSEGPTTG